MSGRQGTDGAAAARASESFWRTFGLVWHVNGEETA
jgi:hypothetical protein